MVMRGGREDRQYLAELVLERKLGRPLKSGEYVVYTNGVLTDLRRENITLGDLQEALYMQRKKGNAHLIGVKPTKGGKWQAYRSTTEEERAQGKTGSSQNIGVYDTAIEAALAYDEAVTRLRWPKKTRLNFPKSI